MNADKPVAAPAPPNWLARVCWSDLLVGLVLAGLLLPEAVAYSSIANLPPQAGVLALFAGLVCYGLIGTSRFAIVAATSSSAAVLASASASMAAGNDTLRVAGAIGLVIVTGLLFLVAGFARIGGVSDFIARPVLRGFAFGLAIVIILRQFASVVGVHPAHADLIRYVAELCNGVARWNLAGAAVCALALAVLFVCARVRHVQGGLLILVLGVAAGKWLDLAHYGIALVGTIDVQLARPSLPALSYAEWLRTAELGMAMVLILYAESYSAIRSFALIHGDSVAPDRDLLALGMANLVSGLLHGMPVGAGYSATSANEAAGASSRLAGWAAALALLVIVLTLLPAVAYTPQPVLAAIVIHAVSHTLRPAVFIPYFTWRRDRVVVVAAVLAVLVLGVLDGLLAAIAVSLLMLLRRLAESSVTVLGRLGQGHLFVSTVAHPDAQPVPGVLILRPDTGLFFANAERVLAQARQRIASAGADAHTVIVSLEESPDLDSSSVESLRDFCAAVTGQGKRLLLARLKTPVQMVLRRAALAGLPTATLCDLSVDDAVALALAQGAA